MRRIQIFSKLRKNAKHADGRYSQFTGTPLAGISRSAFSGHATVEADGARLAEAVLALSRQTQKFSRALILRASPD